MAFNWRLRLQKIRSGRHRQSKRNEQADDISRILNEDPHEGVKVVLFKICKQDMNEEVLLNYLNTLVKLTLLVDGEFNSTGFSTEDILCCLRVLLTHESTQIRSGGMRCIRHVLKNEEDVIIMNKLLIPFLVTRCLDLVIKYDIERIEAMKLMRKALILSPSTFDMSVSRNLVALVNEGSEGKDRMLRICLATLSELGVLNSNVFISSGGVAAITRNLLECQTPKIAESLCGVLLLLLDRPETRNNAKIDLHSVAAPFCDFHYKHGWKADKNNFKRDERELRLNCSRLALLTILRSWPGILHFCSPNDKIGFKAIVDVLHLNQLEVRKSVLDLLYELLGLPQPEWTDELSVALSAIDPCEPQASWRLNEGFVVAEGRCVLPHLAKTTPSTTDVHLALLLYCFLENGLVAALTEVVATSDTFISVRATVLLGELLRVVQVLLPPGCCSVSPSLPTLLEYATKSKPEAMGAMTALQQLHKLMKRRPASYSLHLDYILRSGSIRNASSRRDKPVKHKQSGLKTKLHQFVLKTTEDTVKDTGVLLSNDASTWDWTLINIILKEEYRDKIDLVDSSHKTFVKRLIEFFMPSMKKYSHMDLSASKQSHDCITSGIQLIDYLVTLKDQEHNALVLELFKDILNNIQAITSGKSVHDCLFNPQHMVNTQCQSYFLFIGRFAATKAGIDMLTSIDVFNKLEKLATTTNHDCYVKLIISSMDYSALGPGRQILEAVLTCGVEYSRLYATQFLLVLLRAGVTDFCKWGVQLLVKQLNDKCRTIYLSALSTLHEACELSECLDTLIHLNPSLEHLGEKGMLLSVRFLSMQSGLSVLGDKSVVDIIERWEGYFNNRYVKLAEGDMSDALTLHQRNEDGKYDKRASSVRTTNKKDIFLQPHLYGQLSQHPGGFKLLLTHGSTDEMITCIKFGKCGTDSEILQLKSSLWAIGHLGVSNQGLDLLKTHDMLNYIMFLAQNCPVYSIRATAFYCLSLAASTRPGADELFQLGWICTRHNRHEYWPVIKDELHEMNFNDCHTILSDEAMSLGNSFYDFDNIDDDASDDIFQRVNSPDTRRIRQLTLPTNKRPPVVFHKRSSSESKTFDIYNNLDDDRVNFRWGGRFRNSSVTESTTSGVSSCESHLGRPAVCDTLSPIASSSSLSTLIIQIGNFKSSLDTSQRISVTSGTNSDVSTSSTGSFSNNFFLRSLRKLIKSDDGSVEEFQNYMRRNPSFLTPRHSTSTNDLSALDSSYTSMFSVQKFPINTSTKNEEKCYMGICLPQILTAIFPDSQTFGEPVICLTIDEVLDEELENDVSSKHIKHNMDRCFLCKPLLPDKEQVYFKEKTDVLRVEVLRSVEKLANPVWNKHVKQVLLQTKQREPELFKDVCLYSQVCTMITDNAYRWASRRFIHELFLDVAFTKLYEAPKIILEYGLKLEMAKIEEVDDATGVKSPLSDESTKLLSINSLKLICNENKFPIRKNH